MKLVVLFLFAPFIAFALTREEWEATQADKDVFRLERAWQQFDTAQRTEAVTNITPAQIVTNTAPANVIQSAQQLSLMLTNFSAIVAQTGVDYAALKAYAKAHASELSGDQLSKLQAMDILWADVAPYAPDGLVNFKPQTVTTNAAATNVIYRLKP